MPDDQDIQQPPVKKDPFAFKPEYNKQAQPKIEKQAAPKADPFAFKPEYNTDVKKKDGTSVSGKESSPTPSPSASEGVTDTVQSGPKMSDIVGDTYSLLNEAIPPSTDPKINGQRQQVISGVKSGDQGAIKTAKDYIKTGLQKQIDKITADATTFRTPHSGMGIEKIYEPTPEQTDAIDKLTKKMQQAESVMDEYAVNQAANSKEIQTQVRAEVSGKQRGATPNIAAEDLGKTVRTIKYPMGGAPNPNGNMKYEDQKNGLEALINNKQLKINDLLTVLKKQYNPAVVDQLNQEKDEMEVLKSRHANLTDQFPDVAVTQVARVIGDEIAETHPSNMVISKSDVLESAQRLEKQFPGFNKKYGKYINTVAESEGDGVFGMFKEGLVPKGGFTGGFNTAANEMMYGGAKFVAKLAGDKQTEEFADQMIESPVSRGTFQSGATPTKVVYDNKGQAFVEKPNEDYGKINLNSSMRFIGQSLPGLAEWVVAEEATGGVAGLAGAGKAAKATAGLVGASYVTSYDGNYKITESLIDDNSTMGEAKKAALANLSTITTAGLFKLVGYSPSKFIENAVTKAIAPDILEALEANNWRTLPKNKVVELMTDKILPKVKTFAVETAKAVGEGSKVAGAQLADQKIKDFVGQVVNPKKANASTIDENVKSTAQQILFMTLVGTVGGLKPGLAAYETPSVKDALYEIGTRAPQYIERINEAVASGEYTPEQGNKMIATAKTMEEEVSKAQFETNKDGLLLNLKQKRDVAVSNFRKRAAAGMKEAGIDVSEKETHDADQQIKDTQSQNTHLPLEETEAFKTAVEVDGEGKEIGKPKSIEDIEDGKKYKYSKNGKETTSSGLQLLAHIPNSKEYEEPEIKAAETPEVKSEETQTAEDKTTESKLPEEVVKAVSELPGIYGEMGKKDPEAVLKDIAQQAQGIDSEGKPLEGGPREQDMKKEGSGFPPELVDAAMQAFPKESILSPKTDTNAKSKTEIGQKSEGESVPEEGPGKSQTLKEGDVKNKEGAGEKPSPSKQKKINDTLDKIKKYNSEAKGETKRAMLNDIRLTLPEGHTIDYKDGFIRGLKNESGNFVQARSEETNRSEKPFDKSSYKPEVSDMVKNISNDPVVGMGLEVFGADGKNMSKAQLESALNDIKNGKDTLGAKAVYDAIAGMHDRGMMDVRVPGFSESQPVSIDEFNKALKDLPENIEDLPITEISDEDFANLFDDTLNEIENGNANETTTSQTEQPGTGTKETGNKESGPAATSTEVSNESQPEQAAAALRKSAQNLADEGDREGALALYQQADRVEAGGPPGEGAGTENEGGPSGSTGVKKATIEEERNLLGKTKIENQLKRDFPEVIAGAKRLIASDSSDPTKATRFVASLRDKSILTAEETVALSLRKAELQHQAKQVSQDIINAMAGNGDESDARLKEAAIQVERDTIDRIATRTNYEKGLSLAVNKLLFQEDYSADTLIRKAKSKTSTGDLTPEQEQKFKDLADQLEQKQKDLEARDEKISQMEAEQKLKDLQKEKEAKEKKAPKETDQFKAKKEKILKERKDLIEQFKKEVKGGEGPARAGLPLTDKMVGIIAKLAKNYVEDGVNSLNEVVSNIIDVLKEHAPDLEARDVRDAISGYGQPVKSTLSDIQKQVNDVRKQAELVSKIEDVNSGKSPLTKNRNKTTPSDEVVKLNEQLKEAMELAGIDPYKERALKSYKTRLRKQKEKLLKQLASGEYRKEINKKLGIEKDRETIKLQASVNELKNKIDKEIKKIELNERPKWLKRMDFWTKWRRAVLLSSVTTLGKLTAAAAERSIISPMEELVGTALNFVPGINQIAKMAPREGQGFNLRAEAAAAHIYLEKETVMEAIKKFKGEGTLKLLYGKPSNLPEEAINFFGNIHAALKTPAELNEFKRSKALRSLYAEQHGFDSLEPVTEAAISAQAFLDSQRAIFMQDNWASSGYKMFTSYLTSKGPGGEAAADVLRMLLPIVKVPTNFAWEATSYAAGALKALPGIAKAIKGGVENLEPSEADSVMRALKKQGLGLGMMVLGYYSTNAVGGYYTGKRKEGDLKEGDVLLFGHKLPHWMLHAPLIEMLQIGATLRRTTDAYQEKGEEGGDEQAVIDVTKGLYGQVPFFNTAGTLGGAIKNTTSLNAFAGEFLKSYFVPPTVQQAAAAYDTDEQGNPIERKPKTFLEHIQTGIPGLREKVRTKSQAEEETKEKRKATYERKKEEKEAAQAEQ